jgi:hypothetical protein
LGGKADELTFTISWKIAGYRIPELKKLIDAIDGIRQGNKMRFVDINPDRAIMETNAVREMDADHLPKASVAQSFSRLR